MYNMVYAIGRLVSDPEIKETENGRKVTNITLAVPRNYKNADGIYETDFIPVRLWKGIAEDTAEYCHKGDLIGVRGRLESSITTDDGHTIDEKQKLELRVIAEKISFLSTKPNKEE